MRILAFTDLHGSARELDALAAKAAGTGIDALLCAGDFTRHGAHAADVLDRLAAARRPLYAVPGNHEDGLLLAGLRARFDFLRDVNGRWEDLGGAWVCGFGGPEAFRRRLPQDAGEPCPEIDALWRKLPASARSGAKPVVFLTHYPPLDTALDEAGPGVHGGSERVRKFIDAVRPALVVCGHIHRAFGREDRIGPTRVINPGPQGLLVEV